MMRVAALLAWATGLGFGPACVYAIWYLADHGHARAVLGFPDLRQRGRREPPSGEAQRR